MDSKGSHSAESPSEDSKLITKLWAFHLKPGQTADSEEFKSVWRDTLQLANKRYSSGFGSSVPAHTVWQDVRYPEACFMFSGYPSQEATDEADAEYVKTYMPRMNEIVEHKRIVQLPVAVEDLPLTVGENGVVSVGILEASRDDRDAMGIVKGLEIKEHKQIPGSIGRFTGWDVWGPRMRVKSGEKDDGKQTFVIMIGWLDEKYVKIRESGEDFKLLILRKIIG